MLIPFLIFLCWMMAIVAAIMIARHIIIIRKGYSRLGDVSEYTTDEAISFEADPKDTGLRNWLYRAGFRSKEAPALFVLALIGFFVLGLAILTLFFFTSLTDILLQRINNMPGNSGEVLILPVLILPFLLFILCILAPILIVQSVRRVRVRKIEEGMPIVLELLATLSESGLSLNNSIDRILQSYRRDHPLSAELQIYQADINSGRNRTECLRRMAKRVDIISFTAFISAIVLADQRGSSISDALRRQAEELRKRRRERAMEIALTAPVKRVVPMVVCFLPAIFVFTLGPLYFSYFKVFELFSSGGFLP